MRKRRFPLNRKGKRKQKQKQEEPSMIGKIIDLPLVDFERELIEQKVNIGTINNLILNLEGAYLELKLRKDAILKQKFEGVISEVVASATINGLYAEMIKIEQKITFLRQRSKELVDVG